MTANSELTLKQESFCRFYLETGNACVLALAVLAILSSAKLEES